MTRLVFALVFSPLLISVAEGNKNCENIYEEGITYFGEQVKMVDGVLTREECAAICSEEVACAFWSHLAHNAHCRIWSSDVVRSESEHSKDWVSGERSSRCN